VERSPIVSENDWEQFKREGHGHSVQHRLPSVIRDPRMGHDVEGLSDTAEVAVTEAIESVRSV